MECNSWEQGLVEVLIFIIAVLCPLLCYICPQYIKCRWHRLCNIYFVVQGLALWNRSIFFFNSGYQSLLFCVLLNLVISIIVINCLSHFLFRDIPIVATVGILGVTIIYTLINLAYFTVLTPEKFISSSVVASVSSTVLMKCFHIH